eukprot:CAMPEP_0201536972 /NCGR_PEP_ID=MMETSP0161_2-20130828/63386_1 /ASSEMBLY_ACC=CAM_ASM_000251 /TAXON_ID=180227 /ORGANISM="Neoparamoeba aestuarina, Strain SoJaBio B1-5/56/2" /LENGTH=102 /DNA_ID=CAMNT_0047942989 /DNA_START=251 /DNA_END=556 /DNA_ORIENTATION=-
MAFWGTLLCLLSLITFAFSFGDYVGGLPCACAWTESDWGNEASENQVQGDLCRFIDLNGDGLVDFVFSYSENHASGQFISTFLNVGKGDFCYHAIAGAYDTN